MTVSRETVRRRLVENHLKPWRKDMWCIPKVDAEYVARMEDVLDLYAEQLDPKRPVVCFDESPTQLIGSGNSRSLAAPGRSSASTTSTAATAPSISSSSSMPIALGAGSRSPIVAPLTTSPLHARARRWRLPRGRAHPRRPRQPSPTHTAAALYAAFPPAERAACSGGLSSTTRLHASWLNKVEIEIGVLKGQCLDRRIESCDRLVAEIDVWQSQRNRSGARINWMFSTDKARTKWRVPIPIPRLEELWHPVQGN